MQHKIYAN